VRISIELAEKEVDLCICEILEMEMEGGTHVGPGFATVKIKKHPRGMVG